MNRKQLKSIQNIAAKAVAKDQGSAFGRAAAKQLFGRRSDFRRIGGAFIHMPTAALFAL